MYISVFQCILFTTHTYGLWVVVCGPSSKFPCKEVREGKKWKRKRNPYEVEEKT